MPQARCTIPGLLTSLPDDARALLESALCTPNTNLSEVARRLRRAGYPAAQQYALNRHRRGDCLCQSQTRSAT